MIKKLGFASAHTWQRSRWTCKDIIAIDVEEQVTCNYNNYFVLVT